MEGAGRKWAERSTARETLQAMRIGHPNAGVRRKRKMENHTDIESCDDTDPRWPQKIPKGQTHAE